MAKQIRSEELYQKDLFKNLRDDAAATQATIKTLEVSLKAIKKAADSIKSAMPKSAPTNVKGINELNAATERSNQLAKAKLGIDKSLIVEQQRLKEIQRAEILQAKQIAKAKLAEKGSVEQLRAKLGLVTTAWAKLTEQEIKNTKRGKRLNESKTKLTETLKKLESATGDNRRNVGNYGSALDSLKGKFSSLIRLAGQFGLAMGGVAILKNSVNIIKDFEQTTANLASVLGKTRDQIPALIDDAKRLGATTAFTAGEVASLQTEYAKLGFTEKEILAATEATLNLAAATGSDLARAAEVAGATVKGMGLTAEDTMHVTDVMAKSFSTSALDMEKFAESMKNVAPIAKAAGVSVEEATAMLGTLANAGISGSQAGNALKRVLSEVGATGKPVGEALADLAETGLDLAGAEDEVGRNAQAALLVLAENTEQTKELTAAYENSDGAAKQMADTQLNTLGGAMALLQSAWEGFILKMNDASGIGSGLTSVIKFLADNLETIVKIISLAATSFLAYKTSVLAANLATKAYAIVTKGFAIIQGLLTGGIKGATIAMKAFNLATKANPIGLLITLITTAVAALALFGDSADRAAGYQKALNEGMEEGTELGNKYTQMIKDRIAEENRLIDLELKRGEINSEQATQKKLDAIEKEKEATRELISELEQQRDEEAKIAMAKSEAFKKYADSFGLLSTAMSVTGATEQSLQIIQNKGFENYGRRTGEIEALVLELENLGKEEEDLSATQVESANKATDAQKKAAEQRRKDLDILQRRLEDLRIEAIKNDEIREAEAIKIKHKREIEAIKGNSKIETDLRNELKERELRLLLELEEEFNQKRISEAFKTTQTIGEIEKEQITQQSLLIEESLNNEIENQKEIAKHRPELVDIDELKKLLDEKYEVLKTALENERDLLLLNEELTAEERELINEKYKNKIDNLNRDKIKQEKEVLQEISQIESDTLQKRAEKIESENQKEIELAKGKYETIKESIDLATDYFIKNADKRIAKIDEEIQAAQKQADLYRELAANGNITAKESLAEQDKIIAEANLRKQQEEKRKQNILLISSILQAYNSNLEAGDDSGKAFAKAITSTEILKQFITALPAFYEGTETTVGEALGTPQLSGRDGHIIRVDGSEKILNPALSSMTGNMTTQQIAQVSADYQAGKLVSSAQAINTGWQSNDQVLKKFDSLEKAVKSIPENKTEIGAISQGLMHIIQTRKSPGVTTRNKYRIRS